MQTKHSEQLNTQENVEDNHNNVSTLVKQKAINGTPFKIIHQEEKYFLVMGDHRLTEPTETEQETLEKLETEKWLLVMHVAIIVTEKHKQLEAENQIKMEFDPTPMGQL